MNKKTGIIIGSVAAIVIVGCLAWVGHVKKTQEAFEQAEKSGRSDVSMPAGDTVSVGYKKMHVNTGSVAFSFDVPEKWLTETRHSGERELSVDEMRDFLATNYDGDIKTDPKLTSDYVDLQWKDIQKMTDDQIQDAYNRKGMQYPLPFPDASISASDQIQYTDISWKQVDFYVTDESAESVAGKEKKRSEDYFKEWCVDKYGAVKRSQPTCSDESLGAWTNEAVGGNDATVVAYPTDKDAKGNEVVDKGGAGNKNYYVGLGDDLTLVIKKQAKGDERFESDFSHLIETLRFEQ